MPGNDGKIDNDKESDNDATDNNDVDKEVDKNKPPTMAKTDKKKSKSASLAKMGNVKMTGDDPIDVDPPSPPPKKQKDATKRASMYFLTTCKKGYTVNPWSKGAKNYIDMVFHSGGVPVKSKEPNITLNEGGKALRVEWKLP